MNYWLNKNMGIHHAKCEICGSTEDVSIVLGSKYWLECCKNHSVEEIDKLKIDNYYKIQAWIKNLINKP